jgi:P27 family predicted phage terminase small subunit
MTPGPRPKPTHLKLITGNPGRRPLPVGEARLAAALPSAPPHLSPDAVTEWERVAQELFTAGLLAALDRAALAAYCQAYSRWAQAERALTEMGRRDQLTAGLMIKTTGGNAIQNPLVGIANKAAADMVRYAAEFGMTPSARTRIQAAPPAGVSDPSEKYF